MSSVIERQNEFRKKISDLIDEYADLTGPVGTYQIAVARNQADEWTAEDIEDLELMHHVSGWAFVVEYNCTDPSSAKGAFIQTHHPNAQSPSMTAGLFAMGRAHYV